MKTFYNKKMTGLAVSLLLATSFVEPANALDKLEEDSIAPCNYTGEKSVNTRASNGAGVYKVNTDNLNIRKGPSTKYSISAKVNKGQILTVHQISNGWAKVTYEGNSSLYCDARFLTKISEAGKIAEDVYLRKTYDWDAPKLALLKKGVDVEVVAIGSYWSKIQYNGQIGYIPKSYLVESKKSISVEITESTYLRSTSSWSAEKLELLKKGVKAELVTKGDSWSVLKYNGKTGYVANDYFKTVSSSSQNAGGNTAADNEETSTILEPTYLRATTSWSAEKIVLLQEGTKVKAISKHGDWIKVSYNGKTGYVANDFIKIVGKLESSQGTDDKEESVSTTKYTVNTTSLNVREQATTSSKVVGSVKRGDIVEVYSVSNGWAKIKYNNKVAYVSAAYIIKQGSSTGNNTNNSKTLIYLDAGHGGHDPGATGTTYGVKEKDATLDVSKRVVSKLKAKGYQVKYSRSTDVYVPLLERTRIANEASAKIFVSIHFNSATTSAAAGLETLYKVDKRTSNVLADKIQDSMLSEISMRNRGLKTRSDLSVLNNSKMPAVLIEGGFLSNPSDENQIRSSSFRETLANSIVEGIEDYLQVIK